MSLRILYVGHRNTLGQMAASALSQSNPVNQNAGAYTGGYTVAAGAGSTTLANQVNSNGVLGGMVAFARPDLGNDVIAGAPTKAEATAILAASPVPRISPLGLVLNDTVGNAFENTPGVASGKMPYTSAMGTVGVDVFETSNLVANTPLTYAAGDKLYASVNGLLTNNVADALEVVLYGAGQATVIGIVKQAPVPGSVNEMVLDQRI